MNEGYNRCIRHWDEVFSRETAGVPTAPETGNDGLDEALKWLCSDSETVLDFGCGNAAMLFYCALFGTKRHIGIDLCKKAIENAKRRAAKMQAGEYELLTGGVERLGEIPPDSADAVILSNIIDNLFPADAQKLAMECRRILKPGGKALIKLNPHITNEQMQQWGVRVIEGDLLDDGLLLLNRTTEQWRTFFEQYFGIERYTEIWYPQHEQTNRLFWVRRERLR